MPLRPKVIINIPKQKLSFFMALIALLSLITNFVLVYRTSYPEPDLQIQSIKIGYNSKSVIDSTYLDSTFLVFKLYNNGLKQGVVNNIKIKIYDPKDTTANSTYSDAIYKPKIIPPGNMEEYCFKLNIIRFSTIQGFNTYKYPYKYSRQEWYNMAHLTNENFPLENLKPERLLSRNLIFEITVWYPLDKKIIKRKSIKSLIAINVDYYKLKSHVTRAALPRIEL